MASANDNGTPPKRIRDGMIRLWSGVDFSTIATDEALERLALARNTASKTANTFMLWAALLAFLYFLRVQGIATYLKIGEYKLSDLPFGQFVLCIACLIISCVSLVRSGDSRAFDRYLRFSCEQFSASSCEVKYLAFPNEHAWGEPFSRLVHFPQAGLAAKFLRTVSLLFMNLFVLLLVASPLIAGLDFIIKQRATVDTAFQN